MKKWKTLQSSYVHQSPFGNIRKDRCAHGNGMIIEDYYVQEYADWVNAVVITQEQQLVLVRQYRYAGGDFFLEVPAGKIEAGETLEEGLLREVKEETGYTTDQQPVCLGTFMVNPAVQTNTITTYLLPGACRTSPRQLDPEEELTVELFDFERFESLIRTGEIKTQLFTVSAYYMAKNYLQQNPLPPLHRGD